MVKQYRLTRIDPSSGPEKQTHIQDPSTTSGFHPGHNQYNLPDAYEGKLGTASRKPSGHGWRFAFIGLVVVILIVGAALWMNSVSTSLFHLNQTAQHNAASLSHQSAQLTGIRAELHQINQHLAEISQQLSTYFTNIMRAISSGKI